MLHPKRSWTLVYQLKFWSPVLLKAITKSAGALISLHVGISDFQ